MNQKDEILMLVLLSQIETSMCQIEHLRAQIKRLEESIQASKDEIAECQAVAKRAFGNEINTDPFNYTRSV